MLICDKSYLLQGTAFRLVRYPLYISSSMAAISNTWDNIRNLMQLLVAELQ